MTGPKQPPAQSDSAPGDVTATVMATPAPDGEDTTATPVPEGDDAADEASAASFPASDPPARW